MSFADLRRLVNNSCASCHLYPAVRGSFSYDDSYAGRDVYENGVRRVLPGFADAGARMAKTMVAGDPVAMPPADANADPKGNLALGKNLQAWLDQGKPRDTFQPIPSEGGGGEGKIPSAVAASLTNIGNCIPVSALVGAAPDLDARFAAATRLPQDLRETDLTSFDSGVLAAQGTFAYAPTYQLWSDNAKKLRFVHVPKGKSIRFDAATDRFDIPDNTRFYKTFFKQVREADGHVGYRKIETRLIVKRTPQESSLFGSYVWNADESRAVLHEVPYRSGEPFKDLVVSYEVDEKTHDSRHYAIPARHRCIQCHQGSSGENFVLGFSPLQINQRPAGEGGLPPEQQVNADELNQADRLIRYGVLTGLASADDLPWLEETGGDRAPRNVHELRAQAYFVGNCAHCHVATGYPVREAPALKQLDLSPGGVVFQFPLALKALSSPNSSEPYLSPADPTRSRLYRRVAEKTAVDGFDKVVYQHMPLNVPGLDCKALEVVGAWIASIPTPAGSSPEAIELARKQAEERAAALVAQIRTTCKTPADVDWVEEDFTEPKEYVPRRADWNLPSGMPDVWKNLVVSDAIREVAKTPYPRGFWNWKPQCKFPAVQDLPADKRRRWMFDSAGNPRQPYGELFYQSPGASFFVESCAKCHGARADGTGSFAKGLLALSGGSIRVANLREGLFGPRSAPGDHLRVFDSIGPHGGAKYLSWMASGGTNVKFPPGFEDLLGSNAEQQNGGNMLNIVRGQCARLLPGRGALAMTDGDTRFDIYNSVCTLDNPIDPALHGFAADGRTPLDPVAQAAWLDHAQANAGIALYFFFTDDASNDRWPLSVSECEKAFPK